MGAVTGMNKSESPSLMDRFYARTGSGYLIYVVLLIQIINTPIFLLLTAMPAQANAELSKTSGTSLLILCGILVLVRNAILLLQSFFSNRDMFARLSKRARSESTEIDATQEERAWKQITSFGWKFIQFEFVGLFALVILPVLGYAYFILKLDVKVLVYIGISAIAAGMANALLELITFEVWLNPVRTALLPSEFESQLTGLMGLRFQPKFLVFVITLVLVSIFLIAPVAYHQSSLILLDKSRSQQLLTNALLQILNAGAGAVVIGIILAINLALSYTRTFRQMIKVFEEVEKGDLKQRAKTITTDETGELSIYFNRMLERLENLQTSLEEQVAARTDQLRRSATQLQIAARIARDAADFQDINTLLSQIVNIISEQFGFYHTGIFLIDDSGEYVELQAASSEGGKRMLARGHRLSVGQQGIVGAAAYQNRPRIAMDVGADKTFFKNPDLPMTRSEAAVPLTVHGKVIGVLDIQSTEQSVFETSDIEVFHILADQIALAIQNARLIAESQDAIRRLEATATENLRRVWRERVRSVKNAYRYTSAGLTPVVQLEAQTSSSVAESNYLNIPITLRGQRIGTITLHRKGDSIWSESDQSLAIEVSDQVGLALENARLLEDAQRHAAQEQSLSELTASLGRSLDPETILQTAVRELHQLPNVSEVSVYISSSQPSPNEGSKSS
jgi:GAF domain-containing protein/HAMP domain-containing protein